MAEFINSTENPYELQFFKNTPITYNSQKLLSSSKVEFSSESNFRPRIRFKWHGVRGGGCTFPLGVCLVIPINPPKPHEIDDSEEVDLDIQNGKLAITFNEYSDSNFGLTTDGYLPILEDVYIPSEIANQYNLEDIFIKSGVYKAIYDNTKDKYIGVIVDIVNL